MPISFNDHEEARLQYVIVMQIDLKRDGVLAYVVRDRQSSTPQRKDVIVEVLPTLSGQDRVNVLQSFERERQSLTQLNRLIEKKPDIYLNRNAVIKLYNTPVSFTDPSEKYLHLEYLQSGTLTDYIHKKGTLEEADARIIARDIAVAVKAHHSINIIHRNITPYSVYLVIEDNRVQAAKLSGYHLAQLEDQPGTASLDKTKFHPEYLSPEQARPGQTKATIATDIYQIGLLLWEMLAGEPRAKSDDKSISSERLHCSFQMAEIIQRALAYEHINGSKKHFPYTQIDDFIADLQEMIENPPPPYVIPVPPVPPAHPSSPQDNRRMLIIIGLVGVSLMSLVLFLVLQRPPLSPEAIRATAAALAVTDTAEALIAIAEQETMAAAATATAEQIAVAQTSAIGSAQTTVAQTAIAEVLATTRAQTAVAQTAQVGIIQTETASVVNALHQTATSLALSETTAAVATAEEAQQATQTALIAVQTLTAEAIAIAQTNIAATATAAARPTTTPTPTPRTTGLAIDRLDPPSIDKPGCISVGITGVNTTGWTFKPDGEEIRLGPARFDSAGNAGLCGFAPNQEFTFSIFNSQRLVVPGGKGIPAKERDIFVGRWVLLR